MFPIKPNHATRPSIFALALLGPRAMTVIDRYKSIAAIAVYEATLGPKVARFTEVRNELKVLVPASKQLVALSNAEIAGLDAVTRVWSANLQHGSALGSEDIIISDVHSSEGILDNAQSLVVMFKGHGELPYAAQAVSEIEAKYSTAKPAYEAAQAGRVAVQVKQRELRAAAADVQKELVKLRAVVRMTLGSSHIDFQRLRLHNARPESEPQDTSTPATPESSSK